MLVVLGACQSLGAQYRDDVLLVKVVGRSVGLVPLSLALRRSGGTAVVPSGAHQRRGGAARAGSRPERRNPLHLNISKYPLQQGQNTCALPALRGAARVLSLPLPSLRAAPSPLCLDLASMRPSPPFACQTPSTLPCSFSLVSKNPAPGDDFYPVLWSQCAPASKREVRRFRPLQKRTFAFSIFVPQGTQLWNATVSRPHPSRGCQKQRASRRRGAAQKKGSLTPDLGPLL